MDTDSSPTFMLFVFSAVLFVVLFVVLSAVLLPFYLILQLAPYNLKKHNRMISFCAQKLCHNHLKRLTFDSFRAISCQKLVVSSGYGKVFVYKMRSCDCVFLNYMVPIGTI